ncbi:MAG: hypothetical protein IH908_15370 [Proteobacteria bacterium]|nr:hypothetical protein [Pseudomonadota bacterium]
MRTACFVSKVFRQYRRLRWRIVIGLQTSTKMHGAIIEDVSAAGRQQTSRYGCGEVRIPAYIISMLT